MNKNKSYQCSVEPKYASYFQYQSAYCVSTAITSLIGRDYELQAARVLLQNSAVRLLTLAGPGGIGKTRLALQLAAELRASFADGVCIVYLASVSEPGAVPLAMLHALGLRDTDTELAFERLVAF